jgi:stress response protein YsnF
MVGVVVMDREHPQGGWPREAMHNETPEWFMTAWDFDTQHGRGGDYRRDYWTAVPVVSPSEPVSKAEYERVSGICRGRVIEYAERRRRALGLEVVKKRKPRRTKRQMEWERNVTKPAQATLKLEREALTLAKRQVKLEAEYATYTAKAKLPPPITPEALVVLRVKLKKVP